MAHGGVWTTREQTRGDTKVGGEREVFQTPRQMLQDLSLIALTYSKQTVQQRVRRIKTKELEEDEDKDGADGSKTFEVETPKEKIARQQKSIIDSWVDDDDHPVTETDRHPFELYAQLTDDEFLYVKNFNACIYDESRCFFSQWILGKETKELVNSARISALQQGKDFTWAHVRHEILKSLTDVTLTARFLALSRLKRKNGSTAKLCISQVMT